MTQKQLRSPKIIDIDDKLILGSLMAEVTARDEVFVSCGVFGKLKTKPALAKHTNLAKFCQTT